MSWSWKNFSDYKRQTQYSLRHKTNLNFYGTRESQRCEDCDVYCPYCPQRYTKKQNVRATHIYQVHLSPMRQAGRAFRPSRKVGFWNLFHSTSVSFGSWLSWFCLLGIPKLALLIPNIWVSGVSRPLELINQGPRPTIETILQGWIRRGLCGAK